jgi:hypothetical protein
MGCDIRLQVEDTARRHADERRLPQAAYPRESDSDGWPAANNPQIPSVPDAKDAPGLQPRTGDSCTVAGPGPWVGDSLSEAHLLLVACRHQPRKTPGLAGKRCAGRRWAGRQPWQSRRLDCSRAHRPHVDPPRAFGADDCTQGFRCTKVVGGERICMGLSPRAPFSHTKWATFLGPNCRFVRTL